MHLQEFTGEQTARGARAWDLLGTSDARLFLAPDELTEEASTLPLPCRALRIALPTGRDSLNWRQQVPHSIRVLCGRESLILCGSTRDLLASSEGWPPAIGGQITALLSAYDKAPPPLVFAEGPAMTLADRVRLMGILNLTPDSFSDAMQYAKPDEALKRADQMIAEGADIVDLGGESTRPGANPVTLEEESRRILPVVDRLRRSHPSLRISIDTRHAEIARRALDAGCDMINDVSGLGDPEMAQVVADADCPIAIMHMRGTPGSMQNDTIYADLMLEIIDSLREKVKRARAVGIRGDSILVDPGVGFGKSAQGNEELLRQLASLRSLGHSILVGVSRKMFIGKRTAVADPAARVAGSLAAASAAVLAGARVIRVHDLSASRQALDMVDALRRWPAPATGGQD